VKVGFCLIDTLKRSRMNGYYLFLMLILFSEEFNALALKYNVIYVCSVRILSLICYRMHFCINVLMNE